MDRYYPGLLNYSESFLKASKELTKNLKKEFEYFKIGFKSLPAYNTTEEIVKKIIKHIKVNIL